IPTEVFEDTKLLNVLYFLKHYRSPYCARWPVFNLVLGCSFDELLRSIAKDGLPPTKRIAVPVGPLGANHVVFFTSLGHFRGGVA
ncbi:hypothetical protein OFC62_39320, partial [Escherichia coli]|nr:hypothetical protein [Escherichia coli]